MSKILFLPLYWKKNGFNYYLLPLLFFMERFILKFLWLDKTIGVALDQKVGERTLPLTEYYFWPQKDAWEEMKLCLEKKPWIPQNDSIVLLNQITEVINFWQDKDMSNRKDIAKVREKFPLASFVGFD